MKYILIVFPIYLSVLFLSSLILSSIVLSHTIIIRKQYFPMRWMKILEVILEKGKGPVLGTLRNIQLIEGVIQVLMSILINQRNKFKIETDLRIVKSNMG